MKLPPKTIADAWIELRDGDLDCTEVKVGAWVDEALELAIHHDPDYAFEIIEAISDRKMSEDALMQFSVGPLENLLAYQGAMVINKVEFKAKQSLAFISALESVWQRSIPDEIWNRIQNCLK